MIFYIPDTGSELQKWLATCCRGCYNTVQCTTRHHKAAAKHAAIKHTLLYGMSNKMDTLEFDKVSVDFYKQELQSRGLETEDSSILPL